MTKKSKLPDLEKSFAEINALIKHMEEGNLTLEQSLNYFERGVTLIKHAQTILNEAEQKVQLLMKQNGEEQLINYENHNE